VLIGLALIALSTLAMTSGLLAPLERITLDFRFQNFTHFNPPPSTQVVHIDIDDIALSTVGHWPWGREVLAGVVDELHQAGATLVAFDVLFTEAQQPRIIEVQTEDENGQPVIRYNRLDGDGELAAAMKRAANVLMPVNFDPAAPAIPLWDQVNRRLRTDLTITSQQLTTELHLSLDDQRRLQMGLAAQKSAVIRAKLLAMFRAGQTPTFAQARAAVLPDLPPHVEESLELTLLKQELDRVAVILALSADMPDRTDEHQSFGHVGTPSVPIPPLADAAATTGFVFFQHEPDGVVRSIPLWLAGDQKLFPQMALSAACRLLDVPLANVKVTADETILPAARMPDGSVTDLRIPTLTRRPGDGWYAHAGSVVIPWPTSASWQYLYDPDDIEGRQHIPIARIVELRSLRGKAPFNEQQADIALISAAVLSDEQDNLILQNHIDLSLIEQLDALSETLTTTPQPPTPQAGTQRSAVPVTAVPGTPSTDPASASQLRTALRNRIAEQLTALITADPATLTPPVRAALPEIRSRLAVYSDALAAADNARRKVQQVEADFRRQLTGSVAFIGWTATGSIADFVPTSLDARCPGVVIHGALLNAILTNHFLQRTPVWFDALMVVVVGLASLAAAALLGAMTAPLITLGIVAVFLLLNGLLLFDLLNLWSSAAGPITAAIATWVGVTVYRFISEQRDRARITRQFKSYIAPDLVDYLVQNPNIVKLEGDSRELSCVFTDFQGFTTVSEQLGPEKIVLLLNRYLSVATDRLMEHRATVNKYLGDGIMAFWGAPISNADHALDACRSVLAVVDALQTLREDPDLKDLPLLKLRAGITTGIMSVGDFGAPPRRSDYTIIGDRVNLASRLESSNKQFDTRILISDRTRSMVHQHMLCRPVGRLVVVGRKEYEPVWELLNTFDQATEPQRRLAAATSAAVDAYYQAQFESCAKLFAEISREFGPSKLADRYAAACAEHLASPPTDFAGVLVLTEK
jgi:class 3 adenylate cyclase/CHASE2 domain-containing sensor protein